MELKPRTPKVTNESLFGLTGESVASIYTCDCYEFPKHPFKIIDDEKMVELADSIKISGLAQPIIVRPKESGGYEIVSGHRRQHACVLAGITQIPAIVRNYTDDEAIIFMVNSNLQRETVLPSEKAFSYRMKYEALKRQGKRTDLTSDQLGQKLEKKTARERLAENSGDSSTQIYRYIRLTELKQELIDLADSGDLPMSAWVELSYLKPEEQEMLIEYMDANERPSIAQSTHLRIASEENNLTPEVIREIMRDDRDFKKRLVFNDSELKKYFPSKCSPQEMREIMLKLLSKWRKEQKREER